MANRLFARWFTMIVAMASNVSFADESAEKFIDAQIDQLIALYTDGIAVSYPEQRHVRFGKLLKEGEAAVALFSVEGFYGGNSHAEYLAVFEPVEMDEFAGKKAKPYRLLAVQKIGGRSWRTFDWNTVQIASGTITLKGKRWGGGDVRCCPTVPMSATFRLRDDALVEARR